MSFLFFLFWVSPPEAFFQNREMVQTQTVKSKFGVTLESGTRTFCLRVVSNSDELKFLITLQLIYQI